jgi:hypothetical protein
MPLFEYFDTDNYNSSKYGFAVLWEAYRRYRLLRIQASLRVDFISVFGRMNILIDKVWMQLQTQFPELSGVPEKLIVLSFLIRGTSHVLSEFRYEETIMLDTLTRVAFRIINSMRI